MSTTKKPLSTETYPRRLNDREIRTGNVFEAYAPAVSTDWTAITATAPTTQDSAFDKLAANSAQKGTGPGLGKKLAKAIYDFTVSGGAVSDIDLGVTLPADAVITDVYVHTIVGATSGGTPGTTIKVGSTTITTSSAPLSVYNTPGNAQKETLASSATAVHVASGNVKLSIATAALTAGKLMIAVEYFQSQAS